MASSLELGQVLAEIARALVQDLGAGLARIWLLGPGDRCAGCRWAQECDHVRCLHLAASAGVHENVEGAHARIAIGKLKVGQIAQTRRPVRIHDLFADDLITDKAWVKQNGFAGFAGYPLEFRGELLGVLGFFATRALSEQDFELVGMIAAQAAVAIKNALLFTEVSDLSRRVQAENAYLKEELGRADAAGIVGESEALRRALRELDRVAPTGATVLLQGETGTGKELFARALHERSPRRAKALVKVNCAAIAPGLVESELFGHERGAFTGALQRRLGRFELAQGGTLFLDEVGELPLDAQVKLLRVLQEHELERVGGTETVRIDVRVIAATNRDLGAEVRANRFRPDLFFRLNVFPIAVPSLRDRGGDVPLLAEAFVRSLGKRLGRDITGIDDDAMLYLQSYSWPGNVRELQNVLERAAILATGNRITMTDLPELRGADADHAPAEQGGRVDDGTSLKERMDAFERSLIVEALRLADGNQSEAARRLRTSRATLQYKMKAFGL